jgi:hypothetical protein
LSKEAEYVYTASPQVILKTGEVIVASAEFVYFNATPVATAPGPDALQA